MVGDFKETVFPAVTGQLPIGTHSKCDSLHKSHASSRQTESRHRRQACGPLLAEELRALNSCGGRGRHSACFINDEISSRSTTSQGRFIPGLAGQHKVNSVGKEEEKENEEKGGERKKGRKGRKEG